MIKLLVSQGKYIPVVVCAECKMPIKKISDGETHSDLNTSDLGILTAYECNQITDVDVLPEEHEIVALHKNCYEAYQKKHGQAGGLSLNECIYRLLESLGLNAKEAGLTDPDEL